MGYLIHRIFTHDHGEGKNPFFGGIAATFAWDQVMVHNSSPMRGKEEASGVHDTIHIVGGPGATRGLRRRSGHQRKADLDMGTISQASPVVAGRPTSLEQKPQERGGGSAAAGEANSDTQRTSQA